MVEYIAIGDIHGMSAVLCKLLAQVPTEGTLVFLGDYIDRGPDSRGVIDRLLKLRDERPCVFLRGNHEAMALEALEEADNEASMDHWRKNGGQQTLASYGGHLPDAHVQFMRDTPLFLETAAFIFVHAGLMPGFQPNITPQNVLLWIRDPFLSSRYDWGRLVVHGHTPVRAPEKRPNRLNIDTGAVYGRCLTAALLPERRFISVPSGDRDTNA